MYTFLQALFSQIQHIDQSLLLINFANGLFIISILVILDKEPKKDKRNSTLTIYLTLSNIIFCILMTVIMPFTEYITIQ